MKKGLNVVENNKISLKPVKELFGMNFFIPDYQRGYRWGTKQVEDLLRDLEEFYESICEAESSKIIYCLQPLVVMEKDNKYIVIDGQQRLTTVKILLSCLGDNNNYSVEYQTRDKSKDFLDSSTNREYGNSCFAIKRDYVLKKEKGIKPHLSIDDKDEVKMSDEKEAAFVPVCTRNVFSKTYTDYPDDLKYWTEKDAAYYRMDMEKTLWWFILKNPEELADEGKRKEILNKYKESILDVGKYNMTFKNWYENKEGGLL